MALFSCCCSVAQPCLTLCNPMNCSMPGFPVLHHLPELAQTYVYCVSDAIQPVFWMLSFKPTFSLSSFTFITRLFSWSVKRWLIRKDPDAGKDWRKEEKGTTEDEMVSWHDRLDGHEFEQALGDGEGQGSLACCSPWGRKELDTTEWLNWTER